MRKTILAAAALGLSLPTPGPAAETARANIIFIVSDDHSLQTIGATNARLSGFCQGRANSPASARFIRTATRRNLSMERTDGAARTIPKLK